jgi:hypothetical protein
MLRCFTPFLLIHSDTSFTPFVPKWRCVTPWWDTSHQTMT